MTTSLDQKSIDEKIDEKIENTETSSDGSVNFRNGDEALRLIDAEKAVKFSEEYNLKLRRKLVRHFPTAAVQTTQCILVGHVNTAYLCFRLFHAVPVSFLLSVASLSFICIRRDKTSLNYAR